MNRNLFLLLAAIAAGLNGCTMSPKYTRPEAPITAVWPTGPAYKDMVAKPGEPVAADIPWREFFTDEKLQQVIGMALTNNRDLRLAALYVEQARALYGIQRDALFPAVDATASGGKQHSAANLTQSGQSRTTERYDVNLGILSWEVDFFGRIRSLKDSALQRYLATEQARRSAQTMLVSSVANAYLALAADSENLSLAESTFQTQKAVYELVQSQFESEVATELNLRQAEMPMEAARGAIARYTQLVAQDRNVLNLLVGVQIPGELLTSELGRVSPPKEISSGLSSDVLLRRPDVLQAEGMLKAANADIGAARAAFFPRISLTATLGTASDELSGLFKSGSGTWGFAPQIVAPIFDARTWSAHRVAKVQREMAVTQYEKAIQTAFFEVADALAVRGTVGKQVSAQQSVVDAATATYSLADMRYRKGIDSYLTVLDAQRSLYGARQGLISLRLAQMNNALTLYKVLGGG